LDPEPVVPRRRPLKTDRIETPEAAAQVREAMAKASFRVAAPFSLLMLGMFLVAGPVHYFNLVALPEAAILPLLVLDAIEVVAAILLWLSIQQGWITHRWVDPMGFGICAACALVPLASLYLAQDAFYSYFVMLILLGSGSMALSVIWFALTLAVVTSSWAVLAWLCLDTLDLVRFGFAMAAAAMLAGVINEARRRLHVRLELARERDEQRAVAVAEALRRAERELAERQKAEAALSESEERYRELIESQGEGVGIVDTEESFTFANPAAHEIFGVPQGELAGRKLSEFVSEEEWERILAETASRHSGRQGVYEMEITRLDEEQPRTVLVTATPQTDEEGRYAGAFGVFRDITERKRAEAERARLEARLQQARKMESLGILAGGIAHDFNNLLMGVMGHAELSLAALPAEAKVRADIEEILRASNRAAGLCQQMLAYSGKGRVISETVALAPLVEETVKLLEGSLSATAAVKLDLWRDLPVVEGDASQLGQVVMNLITNASESLGGEPGVITVSTDSVTVDEGYHPRSYVDETLSPGRYVRLIVADTGCGMDRETVARVFDPFFTTKFTGRGLGLAAVLGIVRSHRGAIELDSAPGEGTTFRVLLPASEASAEEEPAETAAETQWRGSGVVLLADDEPAVCRVAGRMLESLGFEALTAKDGREAVELFRAEADRIVAVMIDASMPELSGEEAFREIRSIREDARVVLCSGYAEEDAAEHLRDEGLAGFLHKPYRMTALRHKLREVLEG